MSLCVKGDQLGHHPKQKVRRISFGEITIGGVVGYEHSSRGGNCRLFTMHGVHAYNTHLHMDLSVY